MELILSIDLRVKYFTKSVSALADTGCRIPILFRRGLIPDNLLQNAVKPIKLVTADSTPMLGGDRGCEILLTFPVGFENNRTEIFRCPPCWAYESAIQGSDIILGYPFLKYFRLMVDCHGDILRNTSSSTTRTRSISPSGPSTRTTDTFPTPTTVGMGSQKSVDTPPDGGLKASKPPNDSPGSKMKAPQAWGYPGACSRLDSSVTRTSNNLSDFRTDCGASSCSVLQLFPPGSSDFGLSVLYPPSLQPLVNFHNEVDVPPARAELQVSGISDAVDHRGQSDRPLDNSELQVTRACSDAVGMVCENLGHSFLPPSSSLFQCSQCSRQSTQSDFDCGCLVGDRIIFPVPIDQNSSHNSFSAELNISLQNYLSDIDVGDNIPTSTQYSADFCPVFRDAPDLGTSRIHRFTDIPANIRRIRAIYKTGNYRLRQSIFSDILEVSRRFDLVPEVDAFSSKAHSRLPVYWSSHSDAMSKFWGNKILWIHPPAHLYPHIVQKIFQDEARGIILLPLAPHKSWFKALSLIAIHWWDFHRDVSLFEDHRGVILPPRDTEIFRVLFFDAFKVLSGVKHIFSSVHPSLCSLPLAEIFLQLDKPDLRVGGVIECAGQNSKAVDYISRLKSEFSDVLEKPIYARDIDPRIRGPFGIAKIQLKEGAKPLHRKFFRCSGEREEALDNMIQKLISRGWVVESRSEWSSQAFVVPKPVGSSGEKQWRLVLDYRYLNSQTKDDPFPLPLIEDLITKQSKNMIWSIFDLEDGFHQMHLDPNCREFTAFVTPHGMYEWTVLPMGVKNGPSMFQRMIMWVLRDLPFVIVYIDDVLVGTPIPPENSEEDILDLHYRHVREVLLAFRKHKLFAKGAKMHLFMTTIKFCGHILSQGQRRAAPSKLEAIRKWTPEVMKRVTHLKAFLGLAQYYAVYMKNFADIAVPLSRQLKGRGPDDTKISWTDEMRESLEKIKSLLLDNVVLDIADPYKPYILEVDSSDFAVGGVLSQHNPSGELRPVAFFSRKLHGEPGKGQVKWSIREKETYAIVLILQKFRSWVASSLVQILVRTDHESLQHWYSEDLNKLTSSVGRRSRWHEFLSQFNIVVVYTPGETQKVADPLSRAPWHYPGNPEEGDATFHGSRESEEFSRRCDNMERILDNMPVSRVITGTICSALTRKKRSKRKPPGPRRQVRCESPSPIFFRNWDYTEDPIFGPIVNKLKNNESVEFYHLTELRLVFREDVGYRYCVPRNLIQEIFLAYHNQGHPGAPKLLSLVKRRYVFSVTDKILHGFCLDVCHHCPICQAVKPRTGKSPGTLDYFPIPQDIFTSLCMDFLELETCKGRDGREYNYVLVVVCRLSGYVVAIPCQKSGLTAEILAEIFLSSCVCFMGIPNEIVSDQDHLISSSFFSTLCSLVGIDQHFSIIYRPKGNGRAEAAVRTVVRILRSSLAEFPKSWLLALPWALYQVNALPGLILPYSPYRIVFGRDAPDLGDIPPCRPHRINISCESWFSKLDLLRKEIQSKVSSLHERARKDFLSKHGTPSYSPGDKVWVRNTPERTGGNKLDPLWVGPCEILDRFGKTGRYKVALPTGTEDVHMEHFKPYVSAPEGEAIPCHYFKPRPKLPVSDDFVVENILAHKIERGVHFWKVRWRGYGPEEDTWEPAASFVGFVQQDWRRWNKENGVDISLLEL